MRLAAGKGKLAPDGKPMRALLVLVEAEHALYEGDVHEEAKRMDSDTTYWHDALRKLCSMGLADKEGKRGGYRYFATDAGRELVASTREDRGA